MAGTHQATPNSARQATIDPIDVAFPPPTAENAPQTDGGRTPGLLLVRSTGVGADEKAALLAPPLAAAPAVPRGMPAALHAIVTECAGPGRPYSADSYLPPHLIEAANAALAAPEPAADPCSCHCPAGTRTRRNHGVFLVGRELASVYSSRRGTGGLGVTMTIGNGPLQLSGSMSPAQARNLARALAAAAAAVEERQQPYGSRS
jgi:hypothetical protein